MIVVRDLPRPSSRLDVVSVPMSVDFPASTFPTTATRTFLEVRVSATEVAVVAAAAPGEVIAFFTPALADDAMMMMMGTYTGAVGGVRGRGPWWR